MNRKDVELVRKYGKRRAFFLGANSSCRSHIRQHYDYYQRRCKETNTAENERAVLPEILKQRQNKEAEVMVQAKLDTMLQKKDDGPKEFTRPAIVHATTQLVACGNLVRAYSLF
jgi:hypothetical protein